MPLPVIDLSSNYEENVQRWARFLSHGGHMTHVFDRMYHGKKRQKTARELAEATDGLSPKRVTEVAKKLVVAGLLKQLPVWPVVYEKIPEIHHMKDRLLRLARNRKNRESIPTKRRIRITVNLQKGTQRALGRARHITVDELDDFSRVRKISSTKVPKRLNPARLPEKLFKAGIQNILQERGKFVDWGGESNDLFSTQLRIGGKRFPAAFALKGPAVSGVLTPRKMGKHGDQIQRLVSGPARVFLVQYEGPVGERVYEQLNRFTRDKATTECEDAYYGVIGLIDSYRLRMAYPDCFHAN